MSTIATHGLARRFGGRVAVSDVTLTLEEGDCLALFGPNGAGKTTLLRMLAGLLRPTSGSGMVAGVALPGGAELRAAIGYISHASMLYAALSARENVELTARLFGMCDARAQNGHVIATRGLGRRFGGRAAVSDVTLTLEGDAAAWMGAWLAIRPAPRRAEHRPFVFIHPRTRLHTSRQRAWDRLKRLAKAAGLDEEVAERITPHTLRHSYAAHLAARALDVAALRAALRQHSPRHASKYIPRSASPDA